MNAEMHKCLNAGMRECMNGRIKENGTIYQCNNFTILSNENINSLYR